MIGVLERSKRTPNRMVRQETRFGYTRFNRGLDLETPPIQAPPGTLIESQNYEMDVNFGVTRIQGYERFDGQLKPSAAQYAIFTVNSGHNIVDGDTVTGDTSGATSTCIAVTSTEVIVTEIVGDYTDAGEDLSGSGGGSATATTDAIIGGASTPSLNAQYLNLAADEYRADIAAIPGSGAVLGVWMLNDITYGFRDNAGDTATDMYKQSSSGWTQVALGFELAFTSGGTTEITVGQTITGATSSSTAVLTGITLESGTWAGGDAAGRFIYTTSSAAFQSENINVGASTNLATITGDGTAITLANNGRFEFDNHNFGGEAGAEKMYGVNGTSRGFEFNGTQLIPIDTGMTTDTPLHVKAHKGHLFFSYAGSAQHSGPGTPFVWSAIFGAAELAVGDTITGFASEPGSETGAALAIFSANVTHILYGTSVSDWNLIRYRDEVGAIPYSIQELESTYFLDDRGFTDLFTVQAQGNFNHAALSWHIQSFMNEKRTKTNASCISRDKSQYRLFFSDGFGLYITIVNRKVKGMMPVFFADVVSCCYSLEMSDGSEQMMFGTDDGLVYQMDKGTSLDGEDLEAFFKTQILNQGSPRMKKKYHDVTFEVSGDGYAEFSFTYEIGYNAVTIPQGLTRASILDFSTGAWDLAGAVWDTGVWDSESLKPEKFKLSGGAENIVYKVLSESDYFFPLTFSGVQTRYTHRRMLR